MFTLGEFIKYSFPLCLSTPFKQKTYDYSVSVIGIHSFDLKQKQKSGKTTNKSRSYDNILVML